jgi:isopentenyldiphosphate isomerase
MAENLEIYDLDSNLLGIQDRKDFYKEIKSEFAEKGKISRKVKSIRFMLMNSSGRIYLQKRSKIKEENPGLYDKTVGGHVSAGDSFDMTAIRECAEEL